MANNDLKSEFPVTVYFETGSYAEVVACFKDEELYIASLPFLEAWADENRGIITESISECPLNKNG